MKLLENKKALVTGSSRGIGKKITEVFLANGAEVWGLCTKESAGKAELEKLAADNGVAFHEIYADASNAEQLKEVVTAALKEAGAFDVLVNNAGIAQQKLFTDITEAEWKRMTGINLDGVFYCSQQALKRYMLPSHQGVIVNISSMWGQVGASCEVHYSAAKAGVIGLTKALAKEVGLSNIRVNCIAPGVVMTDMMKDFDEETVQALKEETPLNILGTPEDIADAAVYLCSDKAKFITGQILGINGGFII